MKLLMRLMTFDDVSLISQLINEQGKLYEDIRKMMCLIEDILKDESIWNEYANLSRLIVQFCLENIDKIHPYHMYRFCCGITHQRSVNCGFKVDINSAFHLQMK